MKIGINASFARKASSGIGQVTTNFLKKLAVSNSKFQISKNEKLEFVLYLEEDLPEDIKLPENFEKRIFLPFWKRDDLVRKILWEKYYLPKKARRDGCDVFFSLYQCPTILPAGIKHLMLVHDIVPKLFPEYLNNSRKKIYWSLTEKAIKRADKLLAVSVRTEKDLIRHLGIKAEDVSVNYNDCDKIYKSKISQAKSREILRKYKLKSGYILAGGGMEVRKNVEGVIRAYKYLVELNKKARFIKEMPVLAIYGKLLPQLAPLALDAEKLVRELNLTRRVKLLDRTPQADMPALFANALFFAYPSRYEGFGIPVLEAMSIGMPVVTSKTTSLPEVGLDSILYCDPDDIDDIAMVMKNILVNPELRAVLARRSKERSGYFSWDRFVDKTLNVIKNL
ncbi:MAG: glycosyltransferase family 1 protein [Candidatus Moranbacteria bacterium]|nr:glycosyltransferase family 1 protein [bacterium]MDP1833442.1 glycosyltransferase family 1 protein [Candidatus Moranbacteria bacterium]